MIRLDFTIVTIVLTDIYRLDVQGLKISVSSVEVGVQVSDDLSPDVPDIVIEDCVTIPEKEEGSRSAAMEEAYTLSDFQFPCKSSPTCEKTFKTKMDLDSHILTSHEPAKTFDCELCGKSFNRKQYLKKHIETHQRPVISCNIRY